LTGRIRDLHIDMVEARDGMAQLGVGDAYSEFVLAFGFD
jgi:hypothetical protein